MRKQQRPPILTLLHFAVIGFFVWRIATAMSPNPDGSQGWTFDSPTHTMRLFFLAIVTIIAVELLYPVAVWGIGKVRERQDTWTTEERIVVPDAEEREREDVRCPSCGASLFDDAPTCPWCGASLA